MALRFKTDHSWRQRNDFTIAITHPRGKNAPHGIAFSRPSLLASQSSRQQNLTDQIQVQRKVYKYGGFSAVHIGTWITRSGDQRKVRLQHNC
jgi:hypothetical protein